MRDRTRTPGHACTRVLYIQTEKQTAVKTPTRNRRRNRKYANRYIFVARKKSAGKIPALSKIILLPTKTD